METINFKARIAKDYPNLFKKGDWIDGFYFEDLVGGYIKSFIKASELTI